MVRDHGGGRRFEGVTDAHDGDDVNEAQAEYDTDPELRELLTQAAESPTVHRASNIDHVDPNADDDAHRVRVREIAARILVEDAEVFEGLKRSDAGDDPERL